MMMITDNPVCNCNELCTTSPPRKAPPTTRHQPPRQSVQKDTPHTREFFRLPSELRNRVYFLSFRPDCMHGFSKNTPCSKKHVHQSSVGRRNAWKWLVLCHQTNAEAILYHPVYRNEIELRVASGDCARCGYDEGSVLEGAIHARLTPNIGDRYRIEGHCLAMVRNLHLQLDTEKVDREHELGAAPRHDRERFAHNLASIVSLIAGLTCLKKVTLTVVNTFHKTMATKIDVAESVAQLFQALHQKKEEANSVRFSIVQAVIVLKPSVLAPNAGDQILDGDTIEPLLQIAASAGFERSEILTSEIQDRRENYSTAADIQARIMSPVSLSSYPKEHGTAAASTDQNANGQPELYRVPDFDEDFDELSEEEKMRIKQEDEARGKGWFGFRSHCGPEVAPRSFGCVIHVQSKYSGICLNGHTAPLYLAEDLY